MSDNSYDITIEHLCANVPCRVNYIAADKSGNIYAYNKRPIVGSDVYHCDGYDSPFSLLISNSNLKIKPWYTDWTESLIKIGIEQKTKAWLNKLCLFWDDDESQAYVGCLHHYDSKRELFTAAGRKFLHCRPMTKDEIVGITVK